MHRSLVQSTFGVNIETNQLSHLQAAVHLNTYHSQENRRQADSKPPAQNNQAKPSPNEHEYDSGPLPYTKLLLGL